MIEVHDSIILSYNVSLQENYIEFKILNPETNNVSVVCFEGVLTHFFENIMSGSILLEMEESNISSFIEENHDILMDKKNYSWPLDYMELEQLQEILQKQDYRYYIIYSSYGLYGWILAKNLSKR